MDNLPELRDIHLPDDVSVFPPAYGWWVILAALIFLFALYELWKYWRCKSKKLYAQRLLAAIVISNPVVSAREMSEILRRICILKFPGAATLFGKSWIEFLNKHTKSPLKGKAAHLLIDAPYIHFGTTQYDTADAELLRQFCQEWIGENL